MNNYQEKLIDIFSKFRPIPKYSAYPPYHKGLYLEDYFFKFFLENEIKSKRYYIPVFWTSCYNNGEFYGLQETLNSLNSDFDYFTVSQHDDAVRESLPKNTINFAAGGRNGGTPIPLICSPIPTNKNEQIKKDIFCSFVGTYSQAQGPIRAKIFNEFAKDEFFYFSKPTIWNTYVPENKLNEFIDITKRSFFTLCPRGYGTQSFRLYEVMQLGSVPIFVYDVEWLPFSQYINWNDFCVLVHEKDIVDIKKILLSISSDKYEQMLKNGKHIYDKYFTLDSTCETIIKVLN